MILVVIVDHNSYFDIFRNLEKYTIKNGKYAQKTLQIHDYPWWLMYGIWSLHFSHGSYFRK